MLRSTRLWAILGILFLTTVLHLWAVTRLPLDFDEPDYVQAGYGYAAALERGDVAGVVDYSFNREHPPLVKLTYGVAIRLLGERANFASALYAARLISAAFGILAVLVLALFDPLAGGLLALHTLTIKYTSQAYLEALPFFAGLVAVLALTRAGARRDRWFWLSAVALGVTAAGKFTYFPVVFPLLALMVLRKRRWTDYLVYAVAAVAVFWAFNPTLWRDPVGRFADMLLFHLRYSQGANVQRAGYPWFQPFVWLWHAPPWHPQVFFNAGIDGLIFWLAVAGAALEWRRRPWLVAWLVGGLAVLLLWRTKWPQYTLVIVPALCLAAAAAVRFLVQLARNRRESWEWFTAIFPAPPRSVGIIVALLAAALMVGMVASSFRTALQNMSWSHLRADAAGLPGNSVHALLRLPDGSMAIGTDRGLAVWTPQAATDVPDRWQVFTTENSGLPHDDILALAQDAAGRLWAGTAGGLGRWDGASWQAYQPSGFGLGGDRVNALGVDSRDRLWLGTDGGAAVLDGERWQTYTRDDAPLGDGYVLSLAVEPRAGGDVVWFGLADAISRLDTASGRWTRVSAAEAGFGPGGIGALSVDAQGGLWAGSLGGGLGYWNGENWRSFRTSNSDIPNDTVQAIFESEGGTVWVGTALPLTVGGTLSAYDNNTWRHYTPANSAYSGAEPLAIALDAEGRLWTGTQTAGIDILRLDR